MNREKLISKYEDLMSEVGEYDIWEEEILPSLEGKSYKEIKAQYEEDREYYGFRKNMTQN